MKNALVELWDEGIPGRIIVVLTVVAIIIFPLMLWAVIAKVDDCKKAGGEWYSKASLCVSPDGRIIKL